MLKNIIEIKHTISASKDYWAQSKESIQIKIWKLKLSFGINKNRSYIPYIETHLCDHCNLNCKGCGHYSPLVKEKFTDIKQFERDIKELSKKVSIRQIRLMGGEPLLHPDLNKFIEITRKYFPITDIRIVTNGILLPQMPQAFWDILKKNKIIIDLSKYPPCKDKFNEYLELIKKQKIEIGSINDGEIFYNQRNSRGDSDIVSTFNKCGSKNCVNLWNSKLYTCPACYIEYFNNYFDNENKELPQSFDIYKLSGKELVQSVGKPISFCKYCNTESPRSFKWQKSQKEKTEWTEEFTPQTT